MPRPTKRTNPKRKAYHQPHIKITRKRKVPGVRLKVGSRIRKLRQGEVVRPTDLTGTRTRISTKLLEAKPAERYYVVHGKRKPNNFVRTISREQATMHLQSGSVLVTAARHRVINVVDDEGFASVKTMDAADSVVIAEASPAAPLWILQCSPEGYIERKRLQQGLPLVRKDESNGYRTHGSVSGRLESTAPREDLEDLLRRGQERFRPTDKVTGSWVARISRLWMK